MLNKRVRLTRIAQTTDSTGFPKGSRVGVAFSVPCQITVNSAAKALLAGKPTETETGTAMFAAGVDVQSKDVIEYGSRLLRVQTVREVYHEFLGDVEYLIADWIEQDPEVSP